MAVLRKFNNKKGFGFIVAIGMLGLLAFMGLFLIQSSTTEYSQTSLSVYRTMARQLAEAAADEATVMLEERFKDKSEKGYFNTLLNQAATSKPISQPNSSTGVNGSINDFNITQDDLVQTSALIKYHLTRAGFVIENILPTIKDLRPIPQGALDDPKSFYVPTDRASEKYDEYHPFDNQYSRDWYCTLQLDISVSLAKQKKTKFNYQISRDVKLVNVGPIGRNYSFYSILGGFVDTRQSEGIIQKQITDRFSPNSINGGDTEKGRLFLWNVPFQSRVFVHGPAVINLENPNLENYPENEEPYATKDTYHLGAYKYPPDIPEYGPGSSMAYQYSDTFYGFSYYPDKSRSLFPKKDFWDTIFSRSPTKEDIADSAAYYTKLITYDTIKDGGQYPNISSSFLSKIGKLFEKGAEVQYLVGKAKHQKFLPAGPFCRTPWHYLPGEPPREKSPFAPNQIDPPPYDFPEKDNKIRIETRWDPDDKEVGENTGIKSLVSSIVYYTATGNIDQPDNRECLSEFCLNYYNDPDPDTLWKKLKAGTTHVLGGLFNVITMNSQFIASGIKKIIRRIPAFNKADIVTADEEQDCKNLFPTNFRHHYLKTATRHFKDETEIPRVPSNDKNYPNAWIINGIYWLDSLDIKAPITYIGTGTLMVCRYNKSVGPLTIRGDVHAERDPKTGQPLGHLTIFYYPYDNNLKKEFLEDYKNAFPARMLTLEGGVTVEASIFSLCGVRSVRGFNATVEDFSSIGFDPDKPLTQWPLANGELTKFLQEANCIKGNYVNYYTSLEFQGDDLWVLHDIENPLMFKNVGPNQYTIYQEYIDLEHTDNDSKYRLEYERMAHEFFMSPRIQHVGMIGGL